MNVLLDTNVLLDSMLQRPPWHVEADSILLAAKNGILRVALTPLTVAHVFYFFRKAVGSANARVEVRKLLTFSRILTIDLTPLLDADALAGSDFEDNIEIAAAATAGPDYIVTRNPADFAASPLPVISPADLVKIVQATP
jgi:predicted nucleic acid-binding protein